MAKGDDIDQRLQAFAAQILEICEKLPKTPQGSHISGQLMRCGAAGGANYAEVRGAESRKDFIHKLAIALKGLNESRYWLTIVDGKRMIGKDLAGAALEECIALSKILAVSRRTAAENAGKLRRQ